jgi:hypothetical protein
MAQSLSQDLAPEFQAFRSIFHECTMNVVVMMWEQWGHLATSEEWVAFHEERFPKHEFVTLQDNMPVAADESALRAQQAHK